MLAALFLHFCICEKATAVLANLTVAYDTILPAALDPIGFAQRAVCRGGAPTAATWPTRSLPYLYVLHGCFGCGRGRRWCDRRCGLYQWPNRWQFPSTDPETRVEKISLALAQVAPVAPGHDHVVARVTWDKPIMATGEAK